MRLDQPLDVEQVLTPFTGATLGVLYRPDLAVQDILDRGHRETKPEDFPHR